MTKKNQGTNEFEGINLPPGVDVSEFTEDQALGFPPYWNPSDGAAFKAVPVHFDNADSEFERWVWQATHDMTCHRGPKDEEGAAEEIQVKKGDFFSTSNYAQFDKLGQYLGLEVLIFVKGKRKLDAKRTLWEMGCKTTKETALILTERRQRALDQLNAEPTTMTRRTA